MTSKLARREALVSIVSWPLSSVACSTDDSDIDSVPRPAPEDMGVPLPATEGPDVSTQDVVCPLTPEQTEGPYYFEPVTLRRHLGDGHAGVPLQLKLEFVDMNCLPINQLLVEVWHADARGVYSGYAGQGDDGRVDTSGESFLRGAQRTDDTGLVVFETIYPGWYPGRAPHVHFKARLGTADFSSQLYFPNEINQQVYARAPYDQRAEGYLSNARDSIFQGSSGSELLVASVEASDDGFSASLSIHLMA